MIIDYTNRLPVFGLGVMLLAGENIATIPGPFRSIASQSYSPGSEASQSYSPGSEAGEAQQ